ncbi:Choline transporter-like protein 2 [Diplonema papillatum]|nr:Choline transporter-like protein 2 [Diplonema papillatum]
MLWLISRIRIAICVLEEASSALFSAPSVLVIPPLMFLGVCAIFVWFLVIAAYVQTVVDISIADFAIDTSPLNSVDDILSEYLDLSPQSLDLVNNISTNIVDTTNLSDARAGQSSTDEDTIIRYMHAYNFFGFLWCANMLISMAFFVISGVVIMWFWSATTAEILTGEKSKSTVPFAMKNAFYRMLRYHLGTLFFGSLLIAIIQFVRAVLMYVERQLPEELTNSTTFKVIKCLVHCFLAYMERIVKIINCNAYIITGVFGTNFCSSAKRALIFLMANVARAAVLAAMAEIVIFLLKVFICAANVYLAMLMIKEPSLTNDETIESGLFPLFFVLVLSYIIAVIVMNCYDTCISTIFMCSLIDEDRAGDCGDGYVSYVPPKLADLMDNFKAIGELEAEYKAKLRHATAGKSSNPKIRPHPAPAPPASNDVAESKNVPNEGAA